MFFQQSCGSAARVPSREDEALFAFRIPSSRDRALLTTLRFDQEGLVIVKILSYIQEGLTYYKVVLFLLNRTGFKDLVIRLSDVKVFEIHSKQALYSEFFSGSEKTGVLLGFTSQPQNHNILSGLFCSTKQGLENPFCS